MVELDPINPVSRLSLVALLDPHSHGLTYSNDNSEVALKQELLQWMTNNSSNEDKECEEGSSNEKEPAPSPKKKRKSKS